MFTEHQTLLFEGTDFIFVILWILSTLQLLRFFVFFFAHHFQRTKVIVLNPVARVKEKWG